MRLIATAVTLAVFCFGAVNAEEFMCKIKKVDGSKVTLNKSKKNQEVEDETFTALDNVKVFKGKFSKKTKKLEAGDAIADGLKSDVLTKVGAQGTSAFVITNSDNKITEIRVGGGRGGRLEATTVLKDDADRKIQTLTEDITKKQGWQLNVPTADGRELKRLAEKIGAKTVVEIGTSNGISGIWLGMALRKTGGKLITHEIDPKKIALARKNFKAAGVADIVTIVEGDAHKKVAELKGPIDMVFIDADKPGYLDYLTKLLPLVRPGGLICAHNIDSHSTNPYYKAVTTNPDLETTIFTKGAGMSVSVKKR